MLGQFKAGQSFVLVGKPNDLECYTVLQNNSVVDRAGKRLRMSRNCSEKLGDTRAFCNSFAIELLLRGQFLPANFYRPSFYIIAP